MINWKIESRNIKDLKKYEKNPRKLTKEQFKQLKLSMDRYGLIDKPIVNLDNEIIGGHQRIEVLKKSKVKEVECWVPDVMLSEKEVEELCLRLNRNHGEWDYETLANSYEVPDLLDWGFSIEEMELLLPDIDEPKEEKNTKEKCCPHCGEKI